MEDVQQRTTMALDHDTGTVGLADNTQDVTSSGAVAEGISAGSSDMTHTPKPCVAKAAIEAGPVTKSGAVVNILQLLIVMRAGGWHKSAN